MIKKLSKIVGVLALVWLAWGAYVHTSPVVVLHYSAAATEPVVYFFMEDSHTTKETIHPGTSVEFHTPHRPPVDYYISVSLPFASRDDVEIKPTFSRVDVYIGADTRITRTVIKNDFMARFKSE